MSSLILMEPTEAKGPEVKLLSRGDTPRSKKPLMDGSPLGDIEICLSREATVVPFWAAGQPRAAGVDLNEAEGQVKADVGTPVPFHLDKEVHRIVSCGHSRRKEVNAMENPKMKTSSSQPKVIEPTPTIPIPQQLVTEASSQARYWQSTGSCPP